ncbi:MAG TPA: cation diffusion facilitator family transporter [Acidimicrobiia bacterium]|jgi:cobalt-zinc-cadmium efflux system protein
MRAPASASRERRLWLAIALNVAVIALQGSFGFVAHSLGLLADAAHNVSDVAALGVALVAVRLARRAPTSQRSFGMHRAEILAAQVNAFILLVVCGWIGYAAVVRLIHPVAVHGAIVVAVAVFAVVANVGSVLVLREPHDHPGDHTHGTHGASNLNMRAAVTHMGADAAASAGVAIAGVVILATGAWYRLDPAVSLGIAALVAVQAFALLREAFEVLLESTPPGLDPGELIAAIRAVDGVDDAHDLHVWSLSTDVRALSAHVMVSGHPSLEEAQVVGVRVKSALASAYGIAHVTLELECESCGEINERFCAIDRLSHTVPKAGS